MKSLKLMVVVGSIALVGTACGAATDEGGSEGGVNNLPAAPALSASAATPLIPESELVPGESPEVSEEGFMLSSSAGYAAVWTPWTSEEYPPITCGTGSLANGFGCSGSYCDSTRMLCSTGPGGAYGARVWSSYFSEEGTNYRLCAGTGYVTGLACKGSYCDNITIECTTTGLAATGCIWTGYFSEEDPTFVAPAGYFVKGVQCNGAYCDNKRFYICKP